MKNGGSVHLILIAQRRGELSALAKRQGLFVRTERPVFTKSDGEPKWFVFRLVKGGSGKLRRLAPDFVAT